MFAVLDYGTGLGLANIRGRSSPMWTVRLYYTMQEAIGRDRPSSNRWRSLLIWADRLHCETERNYKQRYAHGDVWGGLRLTGSAVVVQDGRKEE